MSLSLGAGCGKRPEESNPEEEIIEPSSSPVSLNYGTMKQLAETVGTMVSEGRFEELSSPQIMESKGTPFLNISTDQLPEVVISVPVTRRTQAEAGVGKVLPP